MLPWKETSVESERLRFIERVTAGEEPVTELCRQSGISRKTGYKLIHRYEAHGEDGLLDRSRAPHDHPNATPRELAERIVEAKCAHPTWGPKKLVAWLRDIDPGVSWPAPSTAGAVLDRAGLVQRRRRRRRASPWSEPFAHAIVPNDVWCIDFKGWFRTGDGTRVDPLTVQDAASRYLIACQRAGAPHRPGDTARVSARLPASTASPRSSGPTTARPSPASAWAASHPSPHGGSSSGSSPSASSRDTPNRTGVSSASTAPSRRRRRRRPGPTGDGSGEPSTTSGTATTTSDPTRPWDSDRRSGSTPPRSGPIPHASARRTTGPRSPCAECATTARSSGRGTESM